MRAHEFLIEYSRAITLQKMGQKLEPVAKEEGTSADEAIASLENIDPTKNKQYVPWLAKQYINKQFRLEDAHHINEVLTNFIRLKNRLPVEQRDLGRFDYYALSDLIDKLLDVKIDKEVTDTSGIFPVVPESKVLYNGPLGQLAIPETEAASIELGRGTKWCTAYTTAENMFNSYDEDGPLYVWRDKSGEKCQFHFETGQFMNDKNKDLRTVDRKTFDYFRTSHPVLKKLFDSFAKDALSDPEDAYYYAMDVIKGRFPEGESAIASDPYYAYYYAKNVIHGRWSEGEKSIASDPRSAYYYAKDVIRGRWPEAEKAIASDPEWAYKYAENVICGRWPEAEKSIASNPAWAFKYAKNVIGGRFQEGEKAIASDPDWACNYARDVIGGRWPECEKAAARNPYMAYYYARNVIGGRFPEGERSIARNPESAYKYARDVIKGPWPEGGVTKI